MAALLTSEAGNTEKVVKYINEARGMSISILPPDVNESDLYFTPVGESIRFGLAAIKNVGENTARAIRESRMSQGEFKSLYDFLRAHRVPLPEQARFRKFDPIRCSRFAGPRESMLASVDDAVAALQRASQLARAGSTVYLERQQRLHFRHSSCAKPLPGAKKSASRANMRCGFLRFRPPLAKYASRLQDLKTVSLDLVEEQRNGKKSPWRRSFVGTRPMRSKKGARWAIFTIQDMTAVQEMLAFPEALPAWRQVLKPGNPLLLKSSRTSGGSGHAALAAGGATVGRTSRENSCRRNFAYGSRCKCLAKEILDRLQRCAGILSWAVPSGV